MKGVISACQNCKHSKVMFKTDLYCMNSQCDEEFSGRTDMDNYTGIVAHDDQCELFEPQPKEELEEFDHEEFDPDELEDFVACSNCDGHPACEDFGCAIAAGIKISTPL